MAWVHMVRIIWAPPPSITSHHLIIIVKIGHFRIIIWSDGIVMVLVWWGCSVWTVIHMVVVISKQTMGWHVWGHWLLTQMS